MTPERYNRLMKDGDNETYLTLQEIEQGWHFCWEFDGLLVGPDMGEMQFCRCLAVEEGAG